LSVLLGAFQVVPFVERMGQSGVRLADDLQRLIPRQAQDMPVGLGRLRELVVHLLDIAQAEGRQDGMKDIPSCLAERQALSIGPAGCGTVSQQEVSKPQRKVRVRAHRQVIGVQILQGAARLGKHGLYRVASERQCSPGGGDPSYRVPGLSVWLGVAKASFRRLELLFHAGRMAVNQ
jgi:hypothetical protein